MENVSKHRKPNIRISIIAIVSSIRVKFPTYIIDLPFNTVNFTMVLYVGLVKMQSGLVVRVKN